MQGDKENKPPDTSSYTGAEEREKPYEDKVKVKKQSETDLLLSVKEKSTTSITGSSPSSKRLALGKIRRILSDKELKQPGVIKLVIDDLSRLESENFELQDYKTKYHELDKEVCKLEEKVKKHTAMDVLLDSLFALGGILMGLAMHFDSLRLGYVAICSLGLGLALIVIPSIIKKMMK